MQHKNKFSNISLIHGLSRKKKINYHIPIRNKSDSWTKKTVIKHFFLISCFLFFVVVKKQKQINQIWQATLIICKKKRWVVKPFRDNFENKGGLFEESDLYLQRILEIQICTPRWWW